MVRFCIPSRDLVTRWTLTQYSCSDSIRERATSLYHTLLFGSEVLNTICVFFKSQVLAVLPRLRSTPGSCLWPTWYLATLINLVKKKKKPCGVQVMNVRPFKWRLYGCVCGCTFTHRTYVLAISASLLPQHTAS